MKERKLIGLLLFLVGTIFFLLNYYTPLLHDDLAYLYKFGPASEVRPTSFPVKNIEDVFQSQYYHYLDVNGRFTSHFLLQFILLFGKDVFNIFNTIVFLMLAYFTNLYSQKSENTFFIYVFIFFSLCFLMPFFGQTMLWTSGSINYLWTSCFTIFFLIIFKNHKNDATNNVLIVLLLSFMSLFIGWMNESITFGIAAGLFVYLVFNYRTINVVQLFMLLTFGLAVLLIIFSPGTFNRVNNETNLEFSFRKKILDIIAVIFFMRWNLLVCIFLLVILLYKKQNINLFFRDNFLLLTAFFFNSLLFYLIGNAEERMLFGNNIFLMIFNVYLLKKVISFFPNVVFKNISIVLLPILFYGFYQAIEDVKDYKEKYNFFENQIKKTSKDKVFYFPKFKESRYVYHTIGGISDSKEYHNRVRKFYYGISDINILPFNIYADIYDKKFLEDTKKWDSKWDKEVQFLEKTNVIISKLPPDFVYKESITVDIIFKNKNRKNYKVFIIPIKGKYYTFFDTFKINTNEIEKIIFLNKNNKVIKELKKNEYKMARICLYLKTIA